MSKALAVLLELKDCSDSWCEYYVPLGIHARIDEAIAELLAQPEQTEQEPVILNAKDTELSIYEVCFSTMVELRDLKQSLFKREPSASAREMYQRGYAKAELDLKREPMTGSEISEGFRVDKEAINTESYWAGVEFAEKAHGIGVDDE